MKPRVAFQVPNTLTGEGNLAVDITFESMDDFSPAAVAREGRGAEASCSRRAQQLANLVTYMDGKTGAEELIAKVLQGPGAAASRWRDAPQAGRRLSRQPIQRIAETRPWPKKQSNRRRSLQGVDRTRATTSRRCCKKEFKPQVRRRQVGGRAGGADAGAAGAGAARS